MQSTLRALRYRMMTEESVAVMLQDYDDIMKGFTGSMSPEKLLMLGDVPGTQPCFNLEKSVGSRKVTQSIDAPGKAEKSLITNKVTTNFSDSPCTPVAYASFSHPSDFFRFKTDKQP